ncbi:MAG: hypothetical protein ABI811_13555 [Acidobacteriota bacterium]
MKSLRCDEKVRLLRAHQAASVSFAAAASELQSKASTARKDDYETLRLKTEDLRVRMEQARAAFDQHISEHDCFDEC